MRSYLLTFGATVVLLLAITSVLSLIFEPFNPIIGDLTRVGHYAEKDFGWHARKTVFQIEENGPQLTNPDILVLGDSYSRGNLWQSVVSRKLDLKIQSFEYGDIACIQNWVDHALQHPTAKTIIIQTVERVFATRFQNINPCVAAAPTAFSIGASATTPTPPTGAPEWHIFRTFKIAYNTLEMSVRPDVALRGNAVNVPIDSSCAKFSNRRPDRMLYFSQDEEKFQWHPDMHADAMANILRIQRLFLSHGKKFAFVIVPDKLSTYENCIRADAPVAQQKKSTLIAEVTNAGVNTPDMLSGFQRNAGKIDDLYLPNDTHFSAAGYLLMGEQLTQFLQKQAKPIPQAL